MFNALLPHFIVIAILLLVFAILVIGKVRYTHIVSEGYAGLLYHQGKFVRVLDAGRHVHWGRHFTIRGWTSAVPRCWSLVRTCYRLTMSVSSSACWSLTRWLTRSRPRTIRRTGRATSITPRNSPCALSWDVAVESLLNQRLEIGAQLVSRVQPEAEKFGINVLAVEVKDVMFPADLKRAFAEVLKAKQEGQAALERARGESAALRNLANAARVLEGNPALMNLRLMQSLSAAQNAGSTLVLGVPGFVPLKNGQQSKREESDAAS